MIIEIMGILLIITILLSYLLWGRDTPKIEDKPKMILPETVEQKQVREQLEDTIRNFPFC